MNIKMQFLNMEVSKIQVMDSELNYNPKVECKIIVI